MIIFNKTIEFHSRVRQPNWSKVQVTRYKWFTAYKWGKFSIHYGIQHLEDFEVCEYCNEIVQLMGEDYIAVCEGCGIVEGHTKIKYAYELEEEGGL